MALRICSSILILVSILFWPFWLTLILTLAAIFYFSLYWEVILLFLIMDSLYGVPGNDLPLLSGFFAITITFFAVEMLKKKLKFYPQDR